MNKFLLIFVLLILSCNENLPPYEMPSSVFTVNVKSVYAYSETANYIVLNVVVKNIYDETFDDIANIDGELVMTNQKLNKIKTIPLDNSTLTSSPGYNRQTGKLVMGPNSELVFTYKWDFTYDDTTNVKSEIGYYVDPNCQYRKISAPIEHVFSGYVTLFKTTPRFYVSVSSFKFCHVDAYVSPRTCSVILPESSCL